MLPLPDLPFACPSPAPLSAISGAVPSAAGWFESAPGTPPAEVDDLVSSSSLSLRHAGAS